MIDFSNHSTSSLVSVYNECAALLGKPGVTRFSDKPTAIKRTEAIYAESAPQRKAQGEALDAARMMDHPGLSNALVTRAEKPLDLLSEHQEAAPPEAAEAAPPEAAEAAPPEAAEAEPVAPPPAAKTPSERWRRAKSVAPSKVAYRPAAGSKQTLAYETLTRPEGVLVEDLCDLMVAKGASALSWSGPRVWGEVNYLFVTMKGYGLSFDGARLKLIVPADERDAKKAGQ